MRSGVRCADTTPTSKGMSNSANACAAASITGQSLSLPMISPTLAGSGMSAVPSVRPLRMRQPVCRPGGPFTQLRHIVSDDVDVADLAAGALLFAVQMNLRVGDAAEEMVHPLVHTHGGFLRCAKHIGHHRDRCDRAGVAERVVQHCAQVLFEL